MKIVLDLRDIKEYINKWREFGYVCRGRFSIYILYIYVLIGRNFKVLMIFLEINKNFIKNRVF